MLSCSCGVTFTRIDNLRRHQMNSCKLIHNRTGETSRSNTVPKQICKKRAADNVGEVIQKKKRIVSPVRNHLEKCECCNVDIPSNLMGAHKRSLDHKAKACTFYSDGVELMKSAFKCRIATYRVKSDKQHMEYTSFFDGVKNRVMRLLNDVLEIHNSVKVNMETFATYVLPTQDISEVKSFNTKNRIVDKGVILDEVFSEFRDTIISQTSDFEGKDSGKYVSI